MRVGLICIATGVAYQEYARGLHKSVKQYWPEAEFILFSDHAYNPGADHWFYQQPLGYPDQTLFRYHTIAAQESFLSQFNQLFYCDADMEFVSRVGDVYAPFGYGLVATLHPGYVGSRGTPETRRESTAFCDSNTAYYCGGFQGGAQREYLEAANKMAFAIDSDFDRGITAVWHDESHWNKHLAAHPPAKVLGTEYCWLEGKEGGNPVLVALDKRKRGNHPRFPANWSR